MPVALPVPCFEWTICQLFGPSLTQCATFSDTPTINVQFGAGNLILNGPCCTLVLKSTLPERCSHAACLIKPRVAHHPPVSPAESLPETTGALQKLEVLSLQHNRLTSLPACVAFLSNLKTLRLDHNELEAFPEPICDLAKLTAVHLSHNRIRYVITINLGLRCTYVVALPSPSPSALQGTTASLNPYAIPAQSHSDFSSAANS